MAEMNRERLEVRRVKAKRALSYQKRQILLCAGTGCIAGGALKLYDYFKEECARRGVRRLRLDTGAEETAVGRIYLAAGFELVRTIERDGRPSMLLYELTL